MTVLDWENTHPHCVVKDEGGDLQEVVEADTESGVVTLYVSPLQLSEEAEELKVRQVRYSSVKVTERKDGLVSLIMCSGPQVEVRDAPL